MIKVALFLSEQPGGPAAVPLFTKADSYFEKVASASLMPEVVQYIERLTPVNNAQYVLLNAMGAGEYWGSNINGDHFPEAALIHRPDRWSGDPLLDRVLAKDWPYGFPTFYSAHPYAHHRNKDSSKAFGEVELVVWNPRMKRVELVSRLDKDRCERFGGQSVWDKLKAGGYPDVSMGCKVPFDQCSICSDWEEYGIALQTFDPKKFRSQGEAVLAYHKRLLKERGRGIRGLSITRKDYCEHASKLMNRILPDGRKVWVYNNFPRFFDISFVFIGADRTAKSMLKIAEGGRRTFFFMPSSAKYAEMVGFDDEEESEEDGLKTAFIGKGAKLKAGEIIKDTLPSQFAAKAVPLLNHRETSLPSSLLDALAQRPLSDALTTTSSMGMVLRPQEFQRIVLIGMRMRPAADKLDDAGVVFPKTDEVEKVPFGGFNDALASLLLPLLEHRSAFGPAVERRVVLISSEGSEKHRPTPSSLSSGLLRKIGAAYNGYRQGLMEHVAQSQEILSKSGLTDRELQKLAQVEPDALFTPLSVSYFKLAFWDEVGTEAAVAGVERGSPSENTRVSTNPTEDLQ